MVQMAQNMWLVIGVMSVVAAFLRIAPAVIKQFNKLNDYPKVIRFLDYTICMVNGEIIFTLAFNHLPQDQTHDPVLGITIVSIVSAAYLMLRTNCLTKSFLLGLFVLIIGLCFIMPPF